MSMYLLNQYLSETSRRKADVARRSDFPRCLEAFRQHSSLSGAEGGWRKAAGRMNDLLFPHSKIGWRDYPRQ